MQFLLCHFRVQGILFTKIGIDELDQQTNQQIEYLKEYLNYADKEFNKSAEVLRLQHIFLVLIFIAHATISDATKEIATQQQINDSKLLKTIFNMHLPSIALKQIAEVCLTILDRIVSIPNEWIKTLSPFILWFQLHIEDGLVSTIFDL